MKQPKPKKPYSHVAHSMDATRVAKRPSKPVPTRLDTWDEALEKSEIHNIGDMLQKANDDWSKQEMVRNKLGYRTAIEQSGAPVRKIKKKK